VENNLDVPVDDLGVPLDDAVSYQEALKDILKNMDAPKEDGSPWSMYRRHIRTHMLKDDWKNFRDWPTMQLTAYIYSRHRPIMKEVTDLDLKFLKALEGFDENNGTVVRQAHSLTMLKSWAGIDATEVDVVAEFGAGYGDMPLLMHNAGFTSKYHIFDFPEFSLLQRWYLSDNGVDIFNFRFHTDLDEWDEHVFRPDVLIAINSFSETDLSMRSRILNCQPKAAVIRFGAGIWSGVNNTKYFTALGESFDHHKIVGTYEATQRFFIGWNK
jgi:hypothetical protein